MHALRLLIFLTLPFLSQQKSVSSLLDALIDGLGRVGRGSGRAASRTVAREVAEDIAEGTVELATTRALRRSASDTFLEILGDTTKMRMGWHIDPPQYRLQGRTYTSNSVANQEAILISSLGMRTTFASDALSNKWIQRAAVARVTDRDIFIAPLATSLTLRESILPSVQRSLTFFKQNPLREFAYQMCVFLNWRVAHPIKSIVLDSMAVGSLFGTIQLISYGEYANMDYESGIVHEKMFNQTVTELKKIDETRTLQSMRRSYTEAVMTYTMAYIIRLLNNTIELDFSDNEAMTDIVKFSNIFEQIRNNEQIENLSVSDFLVILGDLDEIDQLAHDYGVSQARNITVLRATRTIPMFKEMSQERLDYLVTNNLTSILHHEPSPSQKIINEVSKIAKISRSDHLPDNDDDNRGNGNDDREDGEATNLHLLLPLRK